MKKIFGYIFATVVGVLSVWTALALSMHALSDVSAQKRCAMAELARAAAFLGRSDIAKAYVGRVPQKKTVSDIKSSLFLADYIKNLKFDESSARKLLLPEHYSRLVFDILLHDISRLSPDFDIKEYRSLRARAVSLGDRYYRACAIYLLYLRSGLGKSGEAALILDGALVPIEASRTVGIAMRAAGAAGDVANFWAFADLLYFDIDKMLDIQNMLSNPDFAAKTLNLSDSGGIRSSDKLKLYRASASVDAARKNDKKNFWVCLYSQKIEYGYTWNIRDGNSYMYPLAAYTAHLAGNDTWKLEYSEKALDPKTGNRMRANYPAYAEFAVKALSRSGLASRSLSLLERIPNEYARAKTVKNIIRDAVVDDESADTLRSIVDGLSDF